MGELWYNKPAGQWEEAIPLGNGRLGAMVYGGTANELLQVNEESMWYGGKQERLNPDAYRFLPKIRECLAAGKPREAERLMDEAFTGCPEGMHPYQTLGEIQISFDHMPEFREQMAAPGATEVNKAGGSNQVDGSARADSTGKLDGIAKVDGSDKADDPVKADAPARKDWIYNYRRSLSLEESVCRVSFQCGDTVYEREYIASRPADCLLFRYRCEGEGRITLRVRLRRGKFFEGVKKLDNNGILLYGNLGRGGVEFASALRAEALDGSVSVIGETLLVEDAREVIFTFTADTDWHYESEEKSAYVTDYLNKCRQKETAELSKCRSEKETAKPGSCLQKMETEDGTEAAKASASVDYEGMELRYQKALQAFLEEKIRVRLLRTAGRSWEDLEAEHVQDYQGLYDRFRFSLEGQDLFADVPTDERLRMAARRVEAGLSDTPDVGLDGMLFDFGRYLMISCSRPGDLPATLQGLWNRDFAPPWECKYTININTEMNYWPVECCNLSECHKPLFDTLKKMQESGRRTARSMYGCRGFVAHHNTDIHGDTAPQDIWYPGTYWVMGAAWISTHLWKHYQYTLDREFLAEAFPVMAEAALFFVDFLVERGPYLVTSPSVSPENSYILPGSSSADGKPVTASCCEGPTMDNQILRDLFGGCLDAWEALGKEAPAGCVIEGVDSIPALMEDIRRCRDRLMPNRIAKNGTLMEWMEEYEEAEPGHRHISHLYGLFPGEEITVDGTPELAEAARKTLERRLAHGGGHTGWSRAWITNHYASLWDGEAAYASIQKMLEMSTYPNLFDRHPPFQIDGNFGITAACCRMLAQSNADRVVLLPALPKAWHSGSVHGLCLVGNARLDMRWEQGKLREAVIFAGSDYHTTVICGEHKKEVRLSQGESIALAW